MVGVKLALRSKTGLRGRISGIYRITAPSGNSYIGSAIDILARWRQHRYDLLRNTGKHPPLQRAHRKYGIENLDFSVVLVCCPQDLLFYEQRAIDGFRPLYNSSLTAGSSFGIRRSDITRARISAAKKGKKLPKEVYERISIALKGHTTSEETRAKIGLANSLKTRSQETRDQIAATLTGKSYLTEDGRERLRIARLGQRITPETRAKMKLAAVERETIKRGRRLQNGS